MKGKNGAMGCRIVLISVVLLAAVACQASTTEGPSSLDLSVIPFTNNARQALKDGFQVWNDRPGVMIFDYDRDEDLDVYITSKGGQPNWLHRNDGDGTFTNVAQQAGVTVRESHNTGAVACDIDNDGYQDLYVGAWGDPADRLGFRSPNEGQGNKDSLFLNNRDGTFQDITDSAFGEAVNLRSATSIACADVDGDGWADIYVGNLTAYDFRRFTGPNHPGHYNVLYLNNRDRTFTEVAEQAGVRGPQILMRDPTGKPILFEDPETGERYEGYDPTITDRLGNRIGEPTGQTHAVLFFDYDDDGDPDLWVGNDGDRLHVFRNDSSPGIVRFTPVARAMGIDKVGAWMGFAIGDYDNDADLDVFVTNIGYHLRLQPPQEMPGGNCGYHERFTWGTCLHFLLRNDGIRNVPGVGSVGLFKDVAPTTAVRPSPLMPPTSLIPSAIHSRQEVPTGLAAYDFGFGTTFFDYGNDGDQDLYWLGSSVARGAAPGGQVFPAAGRMMQGDGQGTFDDVTVRAHLLDVVEVPYDNVTEFPAFFRTLNMRHENGKGLAHGDLNGDGYVDLIGSNSSGAIFEGGKLVPIETSETHPLGSAPGSIFLWLQGSGENHWITLRLKGRMAIDGSGSNADGIGARVYVKTTLEDREEPLTQVQEVCAGSSYLSMNSIDLEFGLGRASIVDEVFIRWPSGRTQVLKDLPVDRVMVVTEPEA